MDTVRRTIIAARAGVKLLEVVQRTGTGRPGKSYVVESRATPEVFTTDDVLEARRVFAAWVANGGEPPADVRSNRAR